MAVQKSEKEKRKACRGENLAYVVLSQKESGPDISAFVNGFRRSHLNQIHELQALNYPHLNLFLAFIDIINDNLTNWSSHR
jgi:hypothetical protein